MPRIFKISEATLKEGKMALNAYNIPLIGDQKYPNQLYCKEYRSLGIANSFGDHSSFGCITCIA